MFPIPMYMKIKDFQSALRHLEPTPPAKPQPSSIELGKSFTKPVGNATPGQHEEKKGEPPYRPPHNIWHGI